MIDPNHKPVHGSSGYGNMPPMRNVLPVQQQQQHASYGSLPQLLPVSVSVPSSTPELEAAKVPDTAAPKAYSGPSVHTFGFGSDHDANMLKYVISWYVWLSPMLILLYRAIADTANGVYFFVENQDSKLIDFILNFRYRILTMTF